MTTMLFKDLTDRPPAAVQEGWPALNDEYAGLWPYRWRTDPDPKIGLVPVDDDLGADGTTEGSWMYLPENWIFV